VRSKLPLNPDPALGPKGLKVTMTAVVALPSVIIPCLWHAAFYLPVDALPRETRMTAGDVNEEVRLKLEELLIEGMVVGARVDEMNTLTRLLLAHDQHRLV